MHPAKLYTFFRVYRFLFAPAAISGFSGGETSAISQIKAKNPIFVGMGLQSFRGNCFCKTVGADIIRTFFDKMPPLLKGGGFGFAKTGGILLKLPAEFNGIELTPFRHLR